MSAGPLEIRRPGATSACRNCFLRMPMNAVVRITVPQELLSLVRLAHLLQAIEARAQAADPHQYRLLVDK
ncbi:hypothetical protein, partial [Enterococcus faecium]|uniref:hypothetical protein n=1 Tax=Enterococcus faecium TaxID=1352 RepID=UPI001650A9AB